MSKSTAQLGQGSLLSSYLEHSTGHVFCPCIGAKVTGLELMTRKVWYKYIYFMNTKCLKGSNIWLPELVFILSFSPFFFFSTASTHTSWAKRPSIQLKIDNLTLEFYWDSHLARTFVGTEIADSPSACSHKHPSWHVHTPVTSLALTISSLIDLNRLRLSLLLCKKAGVTGSSFKIAEGEAEAELCLKVLLSLNSWWEPR